MSIVQIEPIGENAPTVCECCGNTTKSVWGEAYDDEKTIAVYFVQWTSQSPNHPPNFDLLIGTWGNDEVQDKVLASFTFIPNTGGGSFTVIDGAVRPAANSNLCSKALTRDEVIHDPSIMEKSTAIIDAVWKNDPRIQEIRDFVEKS